MIRRLPYFLLLVLYISNFLLHFNFLKKSFHNKQIKVFCRDIRQCHLARVQPRPPRHDIISVMKKLSAFPNFIPLLLALALLITVVPSVHGQAIVSPTPDFDGNIYYMVQGNDTCLSISLKMGIEIETLRQLNDLDIDCSLIADTRLLLGRVLTATPTSGPTPTPTPVLPTPTPYDGNASAVDRKSVV